jgi:transposase-like protein
MSRFSKEEREELLAKFEKRQIGVELFCQRHNVSRTTIYKWRQDFRDLGDSKTPLVSSCGFISLTAQAGSSSVSKVVTQEADFKVLSISSSFKLSKSDLAIEFTSGCSVRELDAVVAIFRGSDAAK